MNDNLNNDLNKHKKPRRIGRWILISTLLIVVGVGSFFVFRANSIANSITGKQNGLFQNIQGLFAQEQELLNTDGKTNVLVLGIRGKNDPNGGLLADAVMIVSMNEPTGEIALISIPRDLGVKLDSNSGYRKLNSVNALGENRDILSGLELTTSVLEPITGLDIHYGITVDFAGFKGIIDALGGITVNAAQDFYDPNYEGGISVKQGPTFMDAETAHKYVWARLTSNDFDRSRRQREVINGMKDRVMETGALKNPMFLVNTLETLGDDNLKTTMSIAEMRAFLAEIESYNLNEMIEVGYDTSEDGPFTSINDPVAGYLIVPRSGDWDDFQADIQSIFTNPIAE